MNREIPWLRIVLEGVVIVTSILLAFGIDAWWEGRRERADVVRELQNVELELVENRDKLDFNLVLHRRVAASIDELVTLMDDLSVSSIEIPDTLVELLLFTPTTNPSTGAIDALVASGRLSFIRDDVLRRRIAGWKGILGDLEEGELGSRNVNENRVRAALVGSQYPELSRERVVQIMSHLRGSNVGIPIPSNPSSFPVNAEIRGVLKWRAAWAGGVLADLADVSPYLDELLELVRAEIAES